EIPGPRIAPAARAASACSWPRCPRDPVGRPAFAPASPSFAPSPAQPARGWTRERRLQARRAGSFSDSSIVEIGPAAILHRLRRRSIEAADLGRERGTLQAQHRGCGFLVASGFAQRLLEYAALNPRQRPLVIQPAV